MDYLLYTYHSSNIAASAILILSLLHGPKIKLSKELSPLHCEYSHMYNWMAIFTCGYIQTICEWANSIERYNPNIYMVFVKMGYKKITNVRKRISIYPLEFFGYLLCSRYQYIQSIPNQYPSNAAIPPYFLHCDLLVSSKNPVDSEQWFRNLWGEKSYFNHPVFAAVVSPDLLG